MYLSISEITKAAPRIIADVVAKECKPMPWVKWETMEDPFALRTIVRLSVGDVEKLVRVDHFDLMPHATGPHPFDVIAEAVASMPSGLEIAP